MRTGVYLIKKISPSSFEALLKKPLFPSEPEKLEILKRGGRYLKDGKPTLFLLFIAHETRINCL